MNIDFLILVAEIERRKKDIDDSCKGTILCLGNSIEYKLLCELLDFARSDEFGKRKREWVDDHKPEKWNNHIADDKLDFEVRKYMTEHFNIYHNGVLESKETLTPLQTGDIIKIATHFALFGFNLNKKEEDEQGS